MTSRFSGFDNKAATKVPSIVIADVRRLNRLAEILRGAERHFLARLDLDRFACGGVASHAGGALAHLKGSEPGDADPHALLKVLGDQGNCTSQYLVCLLLRKPMR